MTTGRSRVSWLVACCGLGLVPLWTVAFPPMVDLPQHAAQVGTWLRWDGGGFDYAEYFWVNWRTPYLVTNSLAAALSLLVPVPIAFKLVISLAVVGIPLATLALVRESGGNPLWALVAVPAGYSFAFYMGFVAFAVATVLALFFLLLSWRYAKHPTWRRAWSLLVFSQVLFLTHPVAFGWAGLTGAMVVAAMAPDRRSILRRWWPFLAALALPAAWIQLTVAVEEFAPLAAGSGGYNSSRLLQIPCFAIGLPINDLSLVLGLLVLAAPFVAGGRGSHQLARWIPLLTSLGLFLAVPNLLLGTQYLHQRFGAFLIPTLLFALDPAPPSASRKRHRWFLLAPAAVWLAFVQVQFLGFRAEVGAFGQLVDKMEPDRSVLYLPMDARSEYFPYPTFLHFGSWYQATKGGLVDFSFAAYFPNRFRYHKDRAPSLPLGFEWRPWTFDWTENDGARYDYFLVRSSRDPGPIFLEARAPVMPLARASGGWWLFGKTLALQNPPTRDPAAGE